MRSHVPVLSHRLPSPGEASLKRAIPTDRASGTWQQGQYIDDVHPHSHRPSIRIPDPPIRPRPPHRIRPCFRRSQLPSSPTPLKRLHFFRTREKRLSRFRRKKSQPGRFLDHQTLRPEPAGRTSSPFPHTSHRSNRTSFP